MEHLGALWWCNGQIRDPSDGEIGPPWWGHWWPRPRILSKRFNTAPLHSFKLMGPKYWEILDVLQVEKEYMGPQFLIVRLIFQILCDDYQCMILVFSLIYLESWVYISCGGPSGFLKSVVLSFLFFPFIFLSLSGAPLALGPLDIVHPCHPVATPLESSKLILN